MQMRLHARLRHCRQSCTAARRRRCNEKPHWLTLPFAIMLACVLSSKHAEKSLRLQKRWLLHMFKTQCAGCMLQACFFLFLACMTTCLNANMHACLLAKEECPHECRQLHMRVHGDCLCRRRTCEGEQATAKSLACELHFCVYADKKAENARANAGRSNMGKHRLHWLAVAKTNQHAAPSIIFNHFFAPFNSFSPVAVE